VQQPVGIKTADRTACSPPSCNMHFWRSPRPPSTMENRNLQERIQRIYRGTGGCTRHI